MPFLVIDQEGQRKVHRYVEKEIPHILVSAGIGIVARNPYVSLGVGIVHGIYHFTEPYRDSRGRGGPSGTSPISTVSSKRRQGRASAELRKHGGPRQSSQRGGRVRRKECPKGHYWSYKEKKCLKSKFR